MNTAAASTRTLRSNGHHRISHKAMAEMIAPVPLLEDLDDDGESNWDDLGISSGHGQHTWEEDTAGISPFDD